MKYNLILASQSPRRKELLEKMGLNFRVIPLNIEESYPQNLKKEKITNYLVQKKSDHFKELKENEILITADTIVWYKNEALEKPKNEKDAFIMLKKISGKKHKVYSSICLRSLDKTQVFFDKATVFFEAFSDEEIYQYIQNEKPYDKAGSYGVQDSLGLAKIKKIKGSYYTIMGLPTHILYRALNVF